MIRIFATAGLLFLAACAPRHQPSDEVIALPVPSGAQVVGTDVVTLRAFYVPDIALAELGDASCRVTAGGAAVQVTTPVLLALPKRLDAQQDVRAFCKVQIGPRIVETSARMEAMVLDPERVERTRQYPRYFDVRFPR